MTAKTVVLMLFLASVVDALVLETAMRASVLSRATSATMIWDPTKDEIFDRKSHMLQHSEEALPMYVGPPPGYSKPEDGCEEVTLDQYASTVFGRTSGKVDAWICAEESVDAFEECNYVMHQGELVWACV
uniref:Uncharacterized protein n=1 Tax=Haptolina ericina TaxID=156174 RepID=A0A7S3AR01_9EUKA|mmetsp:Transcript_28242/g.63935  ORF Transcript_28242/g.63935 Transcript_28242/m.63935 type:complete len:130 (+) Transcript_28242:25-414(+)|eukprot:CAMPEP_0181168194 /NCGR_PEP_ID=MMETSP1096-20121128/134_1 /TAXON_ID=156174 ORGANISM="Chrysochromulina ericina, Strain CCMP281" /NCGR_SAMPLE_ID=MMETSP1096 /ASSEMBLY_ACC=CAM_ASM_000453 /LENGTH=129 /DNA_ID=CAMNT_0023255535 /DNA_START=24 /DNA_END=413 /DNA_ORIENTATION=-